MCLQENICNEIVHCCDCLLFFNCSVADAIYRRKTKFLSKLQHTDNTLLAMFCSNMAAEIAKLPV